MPNQSVNNEIFFKRQTTLKEIGKKGQQKLQQAKVAIVGCGGLGSIASVYLAGSGVGTIHLIDYDTIDASNLHRQVFYTIKDIGKPKASVLSEHIVKITPFTKVITTNQAIEKNNIDSILNAYEIVLDCTDNLSIKYLLNDYCVSNDKTLIYGSLFKFDGYVATFNFFLNGRRTANLRDAFPEIPKNTIPNCSEIGTLNTIVGIIGLHQANETLKIITETGKPLVNQIVIYNTLDNNQFKMKISPKFTKEQVTKIYNNENYITNNCDYQKEELLITKEELKNKLNNENVKFISVIEDINTKLPFDKVHKIPLSKLKENPISLEKDKQYIIICNKGISSYDATLFLKKLHPNTSILSLKNGINSFL